MVYKYVQICNLFVCKGDLFTRSPHIRQIYQINIKTGIKLNFWKMHTIVNDDCFFLTDTDVYLHLKEVKQEAVDLPRQHI